MNLISNLTEHPKDQLFPEKSSEDLYDQHVIYDDPDWRVDIHYARGTIDPQTDWSINAFSDRDQMLRSELGERLRERAHLPTAERYAGFEEGLKGKLLGTLKRLGHILCSFSVEEGLRNYDLELQGKSRFLAEVNASAKTVRDFDIKIIPSSSLLKGLNLTATNYNKLHSHSHWYFNGLPAYRFNEEGKEIIVHDTVTSSNDRTSDHIAMMRRIDAHDGVAIGQRSSIAYTGRPDTEKKAHEQISFILQSEMTKDPSKRKIRFNEMTGVWELTYVVNNLMSSQGLPLLSKFGVTGIRGLDERNSILNEQTILNNFKGGTFDIDGIRVKINPIYFNQSFNFLSQLYSSSLESKINTQGLQELRAFADQISSTLPAREMTLLRSAFTHLENPSLLLPEEEYFYRSLIVKILNIPEVVHCKSSTDRTAIALAVSMALTEWRMCGLEIPPEHPHEILSDERFKELFAANIMQGHQVTRVARTTEGILLGQKQPTQILGFKWGGNGVTKNSTALRLFPERYKKEGSRPGHIKLALKVLKLVHKLFPKITENYILFLEKAYIPQKFDLEGRYIAERNLFNPKKMKHFYRTPDQFPVGVTA